MFKKDFNKWNKDKQKLDASKLERAEFKEREIWHAKIGVNIGFEQDSNGEEALRPLMIVRKFNKEIFFGVPLSKTKNDGIFYYGFTFIEGVESKAVLSQMKLVDAKRLVKKIGVINEEDFIKLKKKLKDLIP